MADATRDTWHIEDCLDGWRLVVHPRISWRWFIPRTLTEWLTFSSFFVLAYLSFPGFVLNGAAWSLDNVLLTLGVLLGIFGFYVAALWFIYVPPSIRQVVEAQRPIVVTIRSSSFECGEGVFQTDCLSSLRLDPIPRLGRYRIVFTGTALKEALLIDWPGLPEDTAREVLAEVSARTGGGIS